MHHKTSIWRNLLRNSAVLLLGSTASQAISFVTFLLLARYLGPEAVGKFALLQTYTAAVYIVCGCQSWFAITKFGADALASNNSAAMASLLKIGFYLDLATATVSTGISVALSPFAARLLGFEPEEVMLIWAYSVVLLFRVTSLQESTFRIYDRLDMLSKTRVALAVLRLASAIYGYWFGCPLLYFVWCWVASELLVNVVSMYFALRLLSRKRVAHLLRRIPINGNNEHTGLFRFLVSTNLSSTVQFSVKEADVIIVGAILGSFETGLYKVAREFARIPALVVTPIQQAVFPELTRLAAKSNFMSFRSLTLRTSLMSGAIGIAAWVFMWVGIPRVLGITVGPDFTNAYPVIMTYLTATVIFTFGIPLRPGVHSLGRPDLELRVFVGASLCYFLSLSIMISYFGAVGVAAAHICFSFAWIMGMTYVLSSLLRSNVQRA